MRNKCYCKNCTKRYLGCHDKCISYKMFKFEIREINKNRGVLYETNSIVLESRKRHSMI